MQEDTKPCPLCRKPGLRSATRNRPFCANDRCSMNSITFSDEEWDGLYQAMQLKRAVDLAEKRSPYITAMHFDWGWNVCLAARLPTTDVVRGEGSTLAAALIALAGENKEQ